MARASFWRFSIIGSLLPSDSLATIPSLHAPRPTPQDPHVRHRCRAPNWVQRALPGRGVNMLRIATFFRFFRKFGKIGFHVTSYIIEGCGYLPLELIRCRLDPTA